MKLNKTIVGKRLRKQREKLSLTREAFAEYIDISPQFLAEVENGKKGMSVETLFKICNKFEISADYLIMGRENTSNISTPIAQMLLNMDNEKLNIFENLLSEFMQISKALKK